MRKPNWNSILILTFPICSCSLRALRRWREHHVADTEYGAVGVVHCQPLQMFGQLKGVHSQIQRDDSDYN